MNRTERMFHSVGTTVALGCAAVLLTAQEPLFTAITDSAISDDYAFSVAWGDYNSNGFIDLLAVDTWYAGRGTSRIYLFENQGDGSFQRKILDPAIYQHAGYLNGATWGDYNNDGRPDILVSGGGVWVPEDRHILLHHEPDGSFSRSASPAFPFGLSQAAVWGDFDNDGWLDVALFRGIFSNGKGQDPADRRSTLG